MPTLVMQFQDDQEPYVQERLHDAACGSSS